MSRKHTKRSKATAPPEPARETRRMLPDAALCALAFLALLAIYHANGDFLPGHDATPNVYLPLSVLNDGNLTFDPEEAPFMFKWKVHTSEGNERSVRVPHWNADPRLRPWFDAGILEVAGGKYFLLESKHEGEYVGLSGIGAGLVALPVIAPLQWIAGDLMPQPTLLWFGAKLVAAALIAASGVLVYLIARRFVAQLPAVLILVAYALGTNVWSTSSQTLWQHGPNTFFVTLGVWSWLRIPEERRFAALSGLCFAIAVACRPSSAMYAFAAVVFLGVRERTALPALIGGALPVALGLAWFNYTYFGSPLVVGQSSAGAEAIAMAKTGASNLWRPAALPIQALGQLLSPSRGLLVFSPFLAFSFWGAYRAMRDETLVWLRPMIFAALGVLLLSAAWFDWWGGWSYGPRLLVDTLPILALCLVPVIGWIVTHPARLGVFTTLVAWSILVQITGAFAFDLAAWNNGVAYPVQLSGQQEPLLASDRSTAERWARERGGVVLEPIRRDIDRPEHRARLWSLSDNQILYYLTNWRASRERKRETVRSWMK